MFGYCMNTMSYTPNAPSSDAISGNSVVDSEKKLEIFVKTLIVFSRTLELCLDNTSTESRLGIFNNSVLVNLSIGKNVYADNRSYESFKPDFILKDRGVLKIESFTKTMLHMFLFGLEDKILNPWS
jgi:hypothetical protein